MASDGEYNYEEEWEDEEASVRKQKMVSDTGGVVYPMEKDGSDNTRDVEVIQHKDWASTFGLKAVEIVVKTEVPMSSSTWSSEEDVPMQNDLPNPGPMHSPSLVKIHGHHHSRQTPPPAPVVFKAGTMGTEDTQTPSRVDFGALHARLAAKRITEYRKRQALKEDQVRARESAATQQRRQIRRSNEEMHKALGVAGLTAQDHLRLAQRRRKREAKQKEIDAGIERQNRWYNNVPGRSSSASDHVRELGRSYSLAKRHLQRAAQLQQSAILANQAQVKQRSQAAFTRSSGSYVKGSYLLKVAHKTMK